MENLYANPISTHLYTHHIHCNISRLENINTQSSHIPCIMGFIQLISVFTLTPMCVSTVYSVLTRALWKQKLKAIITAVWLEPTIFVILEQCTALFEHCSVLPTRQCYTIVVKIIRHRLKWSTKTNKQRYIFQEFSQLMQTLEMSQPLNWHRIAFWSRGTPLLTTVTSLVTPCITKRSRHQQWRVNNRSRLR